MTLRFQSVETGQIFEVEDSNFRVERHEGVGQSRPMVDITLQGEDVTAHYIHDPMDGMPVTGPCLAVINPHAGLISQYAKDYSIQEEKILFEQVSDHKSDTDDMTITIKEYDDPAALLKPDPDITKVAQRIYLVLKPKEFEVTLRVLRADEYDMTPMDVYHGRTYRMPLPVQTDATRVREWVRAHEGLIRQIFEGHSVSWDGSNNVGGLDEDGSVAYDRLRALVSEDAKHPSHNLRQPLSGELPDRDYDEVGYREVDIPTHGLRLWDAGDYFSPAQDEVIRGHGIEPDTPDEALEEIAEIEKQRAREEGNAKLYGTVEALESLRDKAKAQ